MSNLMDYLDWRGDLTFREAPFNEVDNLILAQLVYVEFAGIVPAPGEEGTITVKEACELFFAAHDHKFAITLGISFIHRNNRNRYRSRIAVRIPVRIDIKPCIQGWKHADCKCDQKRKLISPQPLHITFENPENSPHSLVLLHLFLFLSSNIYYNVFCY